jgi:hypothetical protein
MSPIGAVRRRASIHGSSRSDPMQGNIDHAQHWQRINGGRRPIFRDSRQVCVMTGLLHAGDLSDGAIGAWLEQLTYGLKMLAIQICERDSVLEGEQW